MTIATLCINCLDELGFDNCCEDACSRPLDHSGTCRPRGATRCDDCGSLGFLKEVEIDEEATYDHSMAKEDRRNAFPSRRPHLEACIDVCEIAAAIECYKDHEEEFSTDCVHCLARKALGWNQ